MASRNRARSLAAAALARGDATGWFEPLYAQASDAAEIPWADLEANPNVVGWLDRHQATGDGRRALKVGCGLGDDAEELAARGFAVTAFDIAPTAIDWCRRRFPASSVDYVVADVLTPPSEWQGAFDLVVEAYTLQVLPHGPRQEAAARIVELVAPGGTLLVVARGRDEGDDAGELPWPLTAAELERMFAEPLELVDLEDYLDDERPRVRRLRATLRRR